jgi:hypothetical protein
MFSGNTAKKEPYFSAIFRDFLFIMVAIFIFCPFQNSVFLPMSI